MLFPKKRLSLTLFICYITLTSFGQVQPNSFGNIYIPENGFISVFGHHSFMEGGTFIEPGIIETARSQNPGYIVYGKNSSWSGASSTQYVDGYVKSYHVNPFTFPLGNKGHYCPIMLSQPYGSIAGYYYKNPNSLSNSLDESIEEMNKNEFWDIKFTTPSKLTITWNELSNLDDKSIEQLSIIALSKDGIWEPIPSSVDEPVINPSVHNALFYSTLKSASAYGSISSSMEISPDLYQYFTLGYIKQEQKAFNVTAKIFPNPQFTGSTVTIDLESEKQLSGLDIAIHKSDNSLIYTAHIDEAKHLIDLPYHFRESGSYIVTIKTGQTILHKNLVIIDQ